MSIVNAIGLIKIGSSFARTPDQLSVGVGEMTDHVIFIGCAEVMIRTEIVVSRHGE